MYNTVCELCLEVVITICSFILPRLVLSHFGSAYNGITQSISQFIGCVSLLKSGIGSVTRAALYDPLCKNDYIGISEIVNATEHFMRKIALIFSGIVVVFALLYPFIVRNEFDWLFAFTLILILSVSTFAQYFFGFTYQMVLQADQRNYIISIVNIITTIINTLVASLLILIGASIHIVKLGSALVFIIPPIFYMYYVRRKYKIYRNVKPNYNLISQRWDAFGHQLANFVNLNSDVIIITIILGLKEVSVYTIFYMIVNAVKKIIVAVSTGTSAAFGNMIAKNEVNILRKRFEQYELLIIAMATILFIIAAEMLIPFISLYTVGITDVNYIRYDFVIFVCLSEFFICTKIPYEQLVFASGDFKQTSKMAYAEAFIHLILSISFAFAFGLTGVIVGRIFSSIYRTIRYHIYVSEKIILRDKRSLFYKASVSIICSVICYIVFSILPAMSISNYMEWVIYAIVVSVITLIITLGAYLLLYPNELFDLIRILINIRIKRKQN